MGTRSNYRVIETWKNEKTGKTEKNKLVNIYVQFDGYPSGHPMETMEWLASGTVVNGLGMDRPKTVFNGASCLAAQLVARLKNGPGGTYIHPMNHFGLCGEDYMYDIIVDGYTIKIIVYSNTSKKRFSGKKLFEGTPEEYVKHFTKSE